MRFATCHPDRKYRAKGLCGACYTKHMLGKGNNRERLKVWNRANYYRYREDMFKALGHFCSCCGETEKVFLTLEHKNGGGSQHRKEFGSGFGALLDARKQGFPQDKYTVLCMNCQRGVLRPEGCPHQRNVNAN